MIDHWFVVLRVLRRKQSEQARRRTFTSAMCVRAMLLSYPPDGTMPAHHWRTTLDLKSQVVLLQTAHSWANAGVLLGARMHRERVAFETIKVSG